MNWQAEAACTLVNNLGVTRRSAGSRVYDINSLSSTSRYKRQNEPLSRDVSDGVATPPCPFTVVLYLPPLLYDAMTNKICT